MSARIHTQSPEQTLQAGADFAKTLCSGAIVALYGDLGAGKTEFVRGVCTGLGVPPSAVTSPTFAIVNEYSGGRLPVFHFDVYRVKTLDELFELGYEDYFFGDGVCLIEWPALIEPLLPDNTIRINISHLEGGREIMFDYQIEQSAA